MQNLFTILETNHSLDNCLAIIAIIAEKGTIKIITLSGGVENIWLNKILNTFYFLPICNNNSVLRNVKIMMAFLTGTW